MTAQEMFELRQQGATYEEIAKKAGVSKQAANQAVTAYAKRIVSGRRGGHGFTIEEIVYEGIYEHFHNNEKETMTSFCRKMCDSCSIDSKAATMRRFLSGKGESYFTVPQIKRICEIVGKPFEEVFKKRGDLENGN